MQHVPYHDYGVDASLHFQINMLVLTIMKINVLTLVDVHIRLDVSSKDTVLSVKQRLQEIEGMPPWQQCLSFETYFDLSDTKRLGKYGVTNNSTLKLTPQLKGGFFDAIGGAFVDWVDNSPVGQGIEYGVTSLFGDAIPDRSIWRYDTHDCNSSTPSSVSELQQNCHSCGKSNCSSLGQMGNSLDQNTSCLGSCHDFAGLGLQSCTAGPNENWLEDGLPRCNKKTLFEQLWYTQSCLFEERLDSSTRLVEVSAEPIPCIHDSKFSLRQRW